MMNRRFSLALVAGMFLFGCAADGIAYIQLEWKIASFSVKPQPAVSGRVTVECAWTAKVTGDWSSSIRRLC
jgi:hypothetical protein